jgi:hypothetical protein
MGSNSFFAEVHHRQMHLRVETHSKEGECQVDLEASVACQVEHELFTSALEVEGAGSNLVMQTVYSQNFYGTAVVVVVAAA